MSNQDAGALKKDQLSPNRDLSTSSLVLVLFAVFTWGFSFPLLKIILEAVPPITLAVLRGVIGIIPLIIYMILKWGWEGFSKPLKEDFWFFLSLGVVGITLPNIFQNYGMTMTSAHISSIIQSSGPVFTIIMAVLLLKEPLGINKILGTTIAIMGTILLVTGGGLDLTDSTFIGNFLVLMSAISYSISAIISKRILERYEPMKVATLSTFLGTVILALFLVFESPASEIPSISLEYWLLIIVLALLPGSLALLIWYEILKDTDVSQLILFIYLIPVFATAISYFWPGEIISPTTIFFAFLIVCGVMIAQHNKMNKSKKNR